MKEKQLTKGIFYVLIANVINMIFSLLTNFLLPKYLSVDTYAAIKTFQLYVTYVGVFHLGFIDGIYLKYGGKDIESIEKKDLLISLSTLRIFQLIVTILFAAVSLILKDITIFMFALALLPLNIASYFKMLYQSVGEFKRYSSITNYTALLTFLANMVLLVLMSDNFVLYLLCYVIVDIVIWLILEVYFNKVIKEKVLLSVFSFKDFIENIKLGFSLMLGNLASFVLTGLDRWFVKFLMNTYSFAQYSFAVSIENMLNVALTPISIPLYNYFCTEKSEKKINFAYKSMILFGVVIVSSAFIIKAILELFLPRYIDASSIIFFLFAAQLFQIVIKSIYINLYKVRQKQNIYLVKLVIIVISGAIFNTICYALYKNMNSFAIGTLLSSILWFYISKNDFKDIKFHISTEIYIVLECTLFILCGLFLTPFLGLISYVMITLIFTRIFMSSFISEIIQVIKSILKRRKININ